MRQTEGDGAGLDDAAEGARWPCLRGGARCDVRSARGGCANGGTGMTMSRRHASQEHASQKTAADGGEAEPRDGRRRFVLGVAGLASGAVAALVGPLAISACLAQAAEPNAACSSTQGEGTVAVAPASSSTDAEAGSAGPGGDAWSTASTFGFDPFAYMVNEVPMGQTAVLSNATDPNAAPDRSTRALGWEGAMEVTVNSATLYQGRSTLTRSWARSTSGTSPRAHRSR